MRPALDADLLALARPVTPAVRRRIEEHIEAMVAILDELDGDPDLEPSLAATVAEDCRGVYGPTDDREEEDDFEANTDDNGLADYDGFLEQWSGRLASYQFVE